MLKKQQKRIIRHKRVRAKIKGTKDVLRLCVFKSSNHIYAQLIDDQAGRTVLSAAEKELPKKLSKLPLRGISRRETKDKEYDAKILKAFEVGKLIAKKAEDSKIKEVVFDRGGYKYHGRVKALAEGAREGGLKF